MKKLQQSVVTFGSGDGKSMSGGVLPCARVKGVVSHVECNCSQHMQANIVSLGSEQCSGLFPAMIQKQVSRVEAVHVPYSQASVD